MEVETELSQLERRRKFSVSDFFDFKGNNTSLRTEILAGITTFLATMYIIIVNPMIISSTGMNFSGVLTATVLVSAFSSIMMGIYAKNPIVLAPGMGINTFFAYSLVIGMNVKWEVALGVVFWSGVIFLILSILNIRNAIVNAIPTSQKQAVAVGIGLFIAINGFIESGFIVSHPDTVLGPPEVNPLTITFLVGLVITAILLVKKVKGALILGITITTILSIPIGRWYYDATLSGNPYSTVVSWQGFWAKPDFSLFFSLDLIGSLKFSLLPAMFSFIFVDMIDSLSTFIGVAEASGLKDKNGKPRNLKQSLIVDAISSLMSGLFGTSSGSSYIESATGIAQGGRTGMTAVVAGLLFIPFMFFSPLLSIVPSVATAPALIVVGIFMITPILKINWLDYEEAIPAFLSIILIPLTFSINQGISWGLLCWTILKLFVGKAREITPMLIILDFFAIVVLIIE